MAQLVLAFVSLLASTVMIQLRILKICIILIIWLILNIRAMKVLKLRLFGEEKGDWKQSVRDRPDLGILAVSQFTLYAKTDKGSKPDFHEAMRSEQALKMFNDFVELLRSELGSVERVQTGAFGQYMAVDIVNDGPVTILLETKTREAPCTAVDA